MSLKFWLLFLVIAIASVAKSSTAATLAGANVTVGDDIGDDEEMMLDSEASRRVLAARTNKFISYAALKANQVPCSKRGRSYYGCNIQDRQKANPYRRACTQATKCYRYTH